MLLAVAAEMPIELRAINWAVVVDASRSVRVPIMDETQFRALAQHASVQKTLLDGVPVWQLSRPLPPPIRAAARSPLDHATDALAALVDQFDVNDYLALVAATEPAQVLARSTPAAARTTLHDAIANLRYVGTGTQTALALALDELRRGRHPARAAQLLILTDGFMERPDACQHRVAQAAAEGAAVRMLGLGGELAEDMLHARAAPGVHAAAARATAARIHARQRRRAENCGARQAVYTEEEPQCIS